MFTHKYTIIPSNIYQLTLFFSVISLLNGEVTISSENIVFVCFSYLSIILMTLLLCSVLHKYTVRWQFLIVLLLILSLSVGYINDNIIGMYATCALVFGAKGQRYEDVLRYYFSISAFFCISVFILNRIGLIRENLVEPASRESVLSDDSVIRHSFGYVWATDFSTHVFYILLTYWLLKRGNLGKVTSVIYLLISLLVLKYTDARLGVGCIILLVIASFFIYIMKKRKKRDSLPKWCILITLCIPIAAILIYLLTISYDRTDIDYIILNEVLSGRLSIGQDAIVENGIKMFGQKYEEYGGDANHFLYNFIDSAYLRLIIIYGVVYTICYILGFVYVSYKAYQRKDVAFLIAILITGFSGMISQHFIQIFMNPLLIAITATHGNKKHYQKHI